MAVRLFNLTAIKSALPLCKLVSKLASARSYI